jgi:hypothetical protein
LAPAFERRSESTGASGTVGTAVWREDAATIALDGASGEETTARSVDRSDATVRPSTVPGGAPAESAAGEEKNRDPPRSTPSTAAPTSAPQPPRRTPADARWRWLSSGDNVRVTSAFAGKAIGSSVPPSRSSRSTSFSPRRTSAWVCARLSANASPSNLPMSFKGTGAPMPAMSTSMSATRAAAVGWRSVESRASALTQTAFSSAGTEGLTLLGAGTPSLMTEFITWTCDRPCQMLCPVAISQRITPAEKTSARRSTCSPHICSGAMYRIFPLIASVFVDAFETSPLAIPKSRTFTWPS